MTAKKEIEQSGCRRNLSGSVRLYFFLDSFFFWQQREIERLQAELERERETVAAVKAEIARSSLVKVV